MQGPPDQANNGNVQDKSEPTVPHFILSDTRLAGIWLVARVYLGYLWILSGFSVLHEVTATVTGEHLATVWPPISPEILRLHPAVPVLLGLCEVAIGLLFLLGVLTGLTAFVSVILSVNTLYPGPPAIDPFAFSVTILLLLVWRTAGWYGLDRWLILDSTSTRVPSSGSLTKRNPRLDGKGVSRFTGWLLRRWTHDSHS